MDDKCKVEKWFKSNKLWTEIPFTELEENDIFRMFESDGSRHTDQSGNNVWIAISNVYKNKNNVDTINTLY